MALRGEGNISNSLREAGVPNWATPLAIDKEETGASLVAKSMFEGNLVALPFSFAADGLEALFKGRRLFTLLKKEGATDEEATVQAVQEVQEAIRDTLPNAQTGHMNAQDYLDAVSYNATHHPARAWRVQPVPEDVLATGRPVATDHIAAVLDNQIGRAHV